MPWTPEQEQLLRDRWAERASASMIAAELGGDMTRNAVIGKVHRLKFDTRPKPEKKNYAPRGQARAPLVRRVHEVSIAPDGEPVLHVPQVIYQPGKSRPFIDFDCEDIWPDHPRCKFPVNDFDGPNTPDMPTCDQLAMPESPYCDVHHRICYPKLPPRRPPDDRQRVRNIVIDPRRRRAVA